MALSTQISQKITMRRKPILMVNWRRVYALPTRHGLMVGLAVFGVFAISVRIQHNMLLLLSVALFVIFLISVVWAAVNLHALKGQIVEERTLLAKVPAQLHFYVMGRQECYDLRLKSPSWAKRRKAEATALYERHSLSYTPEKRGYHFAPPFMIETHFPFGLVRVWQWLFLPKIAVAPSPDFQRAHLLLAGEAMMADQESNDLGEFNADSLETWQEGVPLSRISWKQYAAKDRLLYKTGAASGQDVVRLYFHDIALDDYESVLSVLCAGAIVASEAGHHFEMALEDGKGVRYAPDRLDEALRKLALCKRGASL